MLIGIPLRWNQLSGIADPNADRMRRRAGGCWPCAQQMNSWAAMDSVGHRAGWIGCMMDIIQY